MAVRHAIRAEEWFSTRCTTGGAFSALSEELLALRRRILVPAIVLGIALGGAAFLAYSSGAIDWGAWEPARASRHTLAYAIVFAALTPMAIVIGAGSCVYAVARRFVRARFIRSARDRFALDDTQIEELTALLH